MMLPVGRKTHRVRFDDLTPGREHSFEFGDQVDALAAHTNDEVGPLIAAVETASSQGLWAAGYVSYEAAPAFDHALQIRRRPPDDPWHALPLAWFGLFRTRNRLKPPTPTPGPPTYSVSQWTPSITENEYRQAILNIHRRIGRGETYQTNHTFRLKAGFTGDAEEFYRDLIVAERGGYGAFLDIGRFKVVSASPEQFFHLEHGHIRVRPMKGTIRRGRWVEEDEERAAQLLASEKDRAENLMIVDLLRNDLGRIAEYGSVDVSEMFGLERYGTLWQLTSQIEAELGPDVGLRRVFDALFPSGSITGAPKASTMAIISDIETTARGIYCGAVGYVAPQDSGETQFNVAIRTVVVDSESGWAEYGSGGGITWDSTPESEYEEALLKTRLLAERPEPFDLLETIRWQHGEYLLVERHLSRLASSARYFGFSHTIDTGRSALARHAATLVDSDAARIRLLLSRSGEVLVETAATGLTPFVDNPKDPLFEAESVPITIAAQPVDAKDARLYHKTTARRIYDRARARSPGHDDVLLQNGDAQITESTIANVAVRFGTNWYTPPIASGCLPGVYRAELLAGHVIQEKPITVDAVLAAEDVALINSVRGWRRAEIVN